MIKIQKISKALILLLAVAGLFSCSDDDNVAPFEVIGDVFTTKRMIEGEEQYARSYYAYGTQPMSAAKVTTPDATEVTLSAVSNVENTWAEPADTSDFSTDIPMDGNYQFDVLNEDVPHEAFDILLALDELAFTTITSAAVENYALTVEWDENADSEGYAVNLLNEEGNIIFSSQLLSNQATKLVIDPNAASGAWLDGYPQQGDTYTLELNTFSFDSDATDLDYTYNIEEIAISEEIVVWE